MVGWAWLARIAPRKRAISRLRRHSTIQRIHETMKTPEELFAALGNRGEYAALPHVTLDEVKMIYAEGRDPQRAQSETYRKETLRWSESYRNIQGKLIQANTVINKLRLAINEAIAISGTGTSQDWTAAQVELCRVLEEVKVMLGEKP